MDGLRRSDPGLGEIAPPEASDSSPVSAPLAQIEARRAQRREAAARRRRRRRRGLIAAPFLALLLWALVSYATWMLEPTSMKWNERSVEWVRQEVPFGNWIVDNIEHVYYTLNAPKKGGPQLKALPAVGLSPMPRARVLAARAHAHATAWPPRIKPIFPHALPGEGVWRPTSTPFNGGPPVLVTTFRTELDYPRIVAYVAWFDHTRTEIAYYPGRYEPPNAAVRGPMMVAYDQRWRLRATFNGGFTHEGGETARPTMAA